MLAALEAGRAAEAVTRLVELWRAHRDERVAELVHHLGARVAAPPLPEGRKAARLEAWLARAAHRDALDLGVLLGAIDRDNRRTLHRQLVALAEWPADPRLGRGLVDLLASPTRRARPTWQLLLGLLRRNADARTHHQILSLAPDYADRLRHPEPWLVAQVERLAATLGGVSAPPEGGEDVFAAISSLLRDPELSRLAGPASM